MTHYCIGNPCIICFPRTEEPQVLGRVFFPDPKVAELEARIRELDALVAEARELIGYAAESSTVTTSDEPGCFWCDYEKHRKKCKANDWLARTAPKEHEHG